MFVLHHVNRQDYVYLKRASRTHAMNYTRLNSALFSVDYYCVNVFFTAIDAVLQDLWLRFGPKQQHTAKFACAVPTFMNLDDWQRFGQAEIYSIM